MGELDRQTREGIVQEIVSGAGGNQTDEFQPLRKIASFLCVIGIVCAIVGGAALACGVIGIVLNPPGPDRVSGLGWVGWGWSLMTSGIGVYVAGALMKLLLVIEGHLREVRDHFRKQ